VARTEQSLQFRQRLLIRHHDHFGFEFGNLLGQQLDVAPRY